MTDNDELSKLVMSEASKTGISSSQAQKAAKMLRSGKVNMAQIAPQLKSMLMQNLGQGQTEEQSKMTARDRLRAKIASKREGRMNKNSKAHAYKKTKERMEERKKKQEEDKKLEAKRKRNRKKAHAKKIRQLEQKIGTVTEEVYNKCLQKISEETYKDDGERNRLNNIVELYQKQKGFTETIKNDNLDKLLESESDVSDIESEVDETETAVEPKVSE